MVGLVDGLFDVIFIYVLVVGMVEDFAPYGARSFGPLRYCCNRALPGNGHRAYDLGSHILINALVY